MEVSEFFIKLLVIILKAVVFVVAVTMILAPLVLKPLMKNVPEECSV